MLENFFLYTAPPGNIETGVYQLPLVILSYIVASFAGYTALSLGQQLLTTQGTHERRLLHWGGAFAMGAGIWSMHFIGMLSYKMRMAVEYEPWLTLLSLLIAVAFAYGVLAIVGRKQLTEWQIAIGAVLLGFGICGMHYTGMAAMQMDADLRYLPRTFFMSVFIAIVASGAALWMTFTLARHDSEFRYLYQIAAALIMGAAICGMHYTGMAASVFIYANCRYDPNQSFDKLALAIALTTGVVLALALGAGFHRRVLAETRVRNSESKLRAMIDNALDAVVAIDQDGKITEWNRQAEIIFGWAYTEAVGRQMAEMIIPAENRTAHYRGMENFLKYGVGPILNKRIEIMALNRSGKLFPVELTITAHKHQDTHHFTAFIRDVTERRKSEETRSLFAAIIKSSDDAIISKDLDGVISSWNAGAEKLYGYSPEEAIGQPITLVIPQDRIDEERQIIDSIRNGASVEHYETVRKAKNGQLIDVSLTVSPILDEKGRIIGASKVARDITQRKRTEEALMKSEQKLHK